MNLIVAILLSTLLYITQADDDFPSTLHLPPYPTKPNNISYYFDHEVYSLIENEKSQTIFHSDSEEKDDFYGTYHIKLYLIFEQFTNFTCLQFNNTREPVKNIGINFFVSKDDKNHVELSRNKENPTIVNLTEKVYKDPFLFRYFLAKALGFVPETQRIDKVSELNIFNDNIEEDFRKEYEESTYYFSYFFESDFDFKSAAMPNYNFSIKTPLKYPKKKVAYESTFYPYYELMMKRNYGFSFSDYKKISYMYCYNDYKEKFCNSGYSYNHGNFSTCLCPEGYAGRYCQIIKNFHHSNCPPELNIIANNPEYKEMTLRAEDNNCFINITASKSWKKVQFRAEKIECKDPCEYDRNTDRIEIKYRDDKGVKGICLFTKQFQSPIDLPALSNQVTIIYKFGGTVNVPKFIYKYKEVTTPEIIWPYQK